MQTWVQELKNTSNELGMLPIHQPQRLRRNAALRRRRIFTGAQRLHLRNGLSNLYAGEGWHGMTKHVRDQCSTSIDGTWWDFEKAHQNAGSPEKRLGKMLVMVFHQVLSGLQRLSDWDFLSGYISWITQKITEDFRVNDHNSARIWDTCFKFGHVLSLVH